MSKALPYTAVLPSSNRSNGRVITDAFWLSCPLLVGTSLAAASWGQMSWWPSMVFGGVYALRLLGIKHSSLVAPSPVDVSSFGVVSHDEGADGFCVSLPWAEVTRVDLVAQPAVKSASKLCFVLTAEAPAGRSEARHVVVPGAQAVSGQLLHAMSAHLGALDQAQLLNALGCREGRFTLWRRNAA